MCSLKEFNRWERVENKMQPLPVDKNNYEKLPGNYLQTFHNLM